MDSKIFTTTLQFSNGKKIELSSVSLLQKDSFKQAATERNGL